MIYLILLLLLFLQLPLLIYFGHYPKLDPTKTYDVCIVLGCPAREDGKASRMQRSRMNKAIELYRNKQVHTILISGAGVRNNYVEADIMAEYALKHNIPAKAILKEKEALNTYDNLRLASQLCQQHQLTQVVVVTSRFHIRRSSFFVRKFFTAYVMCPTDDKEKLKHYLAEYVRMWNTLRIEFKLRKK